MPEALTSRVRTENAASARKIRLPALQTTLSLEPRHSRNQGGPFRVGRVRAQFRSASPRLSFLETAVFEREDCPSTDTTHPKGPGDRTLEAHRSFSLNRSSAEKSGLAPALVFERREQPVRRDR